MDTASTTPPPCRFGGFRLDSASRRVTDEHGTPLALTARAYDVLEHLLRHRDRVVGKDELLAAVWPHVIVEENNLTQAISAIRRALGDSREAPEYVATIPGRGYRFIARVLDDLPAPSLETPAARDTSTADVVPPGTAPPRRFMPVVAIALALLVVAGALATAWLRREPALPAAPATRPSAPATVAVLPFRNAAQGPDTDLLALAVTDLLRDRIARYRDARVIGSTSAFVFANADVAAADVGARLRARFLLQGAVRRDGERLHLEARLIDRTSGRSLWTDAQDGTEAQLAAMRDRVARRVASSIGSADDADAASPADTGAVNLAAYTLYLQGQRLLANRRGADVEPSIALFRRATILDPAFARGYLALAQAQLAAGRMARDSPYTAVEREPGLLGQASLRISPELLAEAQQALDRALELDPGLGMAWVERAGLRDDPVEAEQLYRKGLALSPSDAAGYHRYSNFLYSQYRKGEAIEAIDRARALDPLAPALHARKAFLVMVERSDLASHDRLLREALAINPRFVPGLTGLAVSEYEYHGEFAAAARTVERAIALDPQATRVRELAARIYLDLDDPAAATAVLRDLQRPSLAAIEVALQRRETARAAALVRALGEQQWRLGPNAPVAEAVRDHAIATGDYAGALALLAAQYRMSGPADSAPRMWARGLVVVYADTLIRAGQVERGRALARAMLTQVDSESIGRAPDWFSRERASLHALLGNDERALAELEKSARNGKRFRWWYLAERDPVFERLRLHPRFIALAEEMRAHRRAQRAIVDAARQKGELPARGA